MIQAVFSIESIERLSNDRSCSEYWRKAKDAANQNGDGLDMVTAIFNERDGGYLLFTVRDGGTLVGTCGVYLRGDWAQEDFAFILPEYRKRGLWRDFLAFGESALKSKMGISEFRCNVSPNGAMLRMMKMAGYEVAAIQLRKKRPRLNQGED